MTKPRKKKSRSTKAPAKPQPQVETPVVEATSAPETDAAAATSEQPEATVTSETAVEGSEPEANPEVETSEPEPETDPEPESEPEATEPEATEEPEEAEEPEAPEPTATSGSVMLGKVEGRLAHVPIDVVLSILGETGAQRVEVLMGEPSTEAVQKRMLATDGRATPVVFTAGDPPAIIQGYEAIAAIRNLGKDTVPVILIAPGDVGDAQTHLVEMARKQHQPETSEDDLYVMVASSDDD